MPLGTLSGAQELWEEALSEADVIQELLGLSEEVTAQRWLSFNDELSFLLEEAEDNMTLLERHLAYALRENVAPLIEAAKAEQPLPDESLHRWHLAMIIAMALNDDPMARYSLYLKQRDTPELLAGRLAAISVSREELSPSLFERPQSIGCGSPMTESDRQAFLERICWDDGNQF